MSPLGPAFKETSMFLGLGGNQPHLQNDGKLERDGFCEVDQLLYTDLVQTPSIQETLVY